MWMLSPVSIRLTIKSNKITAKIKYTLQSNRQANRMTMRQKQKCTQSSLNSQT